MSGDVHRGDAPTRLRVIMYHYVRELAGSRFPELKGMERAAFAAQLSRLQQRYELCDLETALAFLRGEHEAPRDLCLLTFDDGLREHHTDVLPLLVERRIQGVFFVTTSCADEHRVASVHKNHHLLAGLGLTEYRARFLQRARSMGISVDEGVSPELVRRTYRWDSSEVASFKYFLNFTLPVATRDLILDALFGEHFGDEAQFARDLYLGWDELRQMQGAGMVIGGHAHRHVPLSARSAQGQVEDLTACKELLSRRLEAQPTWPFSYPYGKLDTFDASTIETLRALAFDCAFTSVVGANGPGTDLYAIAREDPKDL
jgi:peptidoglycan/xylan/chitin deacetylase (PgdA/CDA1 family)